MNSIVAGLQSGDEGKGKICDFLAQKYDVIVRYSGSENTGATVWVQDNKYKFNYLPVGILQNKLCYIASSCYINPKNIIKEIEKWSNLGFDTDKLICISPDCHVISEYHIEEDKNNEIGEKAVGSTKRGVSPCASDKYGRKGTRLEESLWAPQLEKYFADIPTELEELHNRNKSILFEGSQGALLDIDHGLTYPNISTSNNISASACISSGFGILNISNIIGVFKPYLTKVGLGPFPTKLDKEDDDIDNTIVKQGNEWGTTTQRRRNIGWLDLPALKYACRINGCNKLAMTKFDVISGMNIKVCTEYEVDGKDICEVPIKKSKYYKCKPKYEKINNVKVNDIINIVEEFCSIKVEIISFGKNRSETYIR